MKQPKKQEQTYFPCGILLGHLLFLMISPGDECSFRIKLFLNHKMVILPQTNMEQNECIADLLFRSKLRLDNPGACAREYNSIMQIIMECLLDGTLNCRNKQI
jgi:hypothetical protein